MPRWIKTKEWSYEIQSCQGKFAENVIYFDKFKEPCGYLGFGETVLSVKLEPSDTPKYFGNLRKEKQQ